MINIRFENIAIFSVFLFLLPSLRLFSQGSGVAFRVMEYNVENLFDCQHDTLKQDTEFSADGAYHWTRSRYFKKLNNVARGIVLAATHNDEFRVPSVVGLCEVENDSVLHDLCHRSLLRGAGYEYVMTDSPDQRGVDVAFMYQPQAFRLISHYSLRVELLPEMRPTRDILYVKGETNYGILHAFVVHAPSRRGGEKTTRPFRLAVMQRLTASLDSIRKDEPEASILVMGDFNAYEGDASIEYLSASGMTDLSSARYLMPNENVKGTYRYRGEWGCLDHIFVSHSLLQFFRSCKIADNAELLEEDEVYGGVHPRRFFKGTVSADGYSDHLPLCAEFEY